MINCEELQQGINHSKLFWSTKRKTKTEHTKPPTIQRKTKQNKNTEDGGKINHTLKGVTSSTRSSTSEDTWRARTADPSSEREVPHPTSFGSRDSLEVAVCLSASRMPFLTSPHPPWLLLAPHCAEWSVCGAKLQVSSANDLANKAEGKGLKISINADAVVCSYGEASFRTTTIQKKCDKEPRYGRNSLLWLKFGPLFATYLTLYWQAPGQVICQSLSPTGNIKPT